MLGWKNILGPKIFLKRAIKTLGYSSLTYIKPNQIVASCYALEPLEKFVMVVCFYLLDSGFSVQLWSEASAKVWIKLSKSHGENKYSKHWLEM